MDCPSNKELQKFLEKNGFYSYLDFDNVSKNYRNELHVLLSRDRQKSLVLPKHWQKIKDFGKPRNVLVMELGGSYLRLFDAEVIHEHKFIIQKDQKFNFSQNHKYSAEELFTKIAQQLDTFIESDKKNQIEHAVLVFSYALDHIVREDGLFDGIGQTLGKMSQFEKLAGIRIGETLQNLLWTKGYPKIKISVLNDSIANLLSAKAIEISSGIKFDSAINILVGTGLNIGLRYDEDGKSTELINTEFGNFKGAEISNFDKVIRDKHSFGTDYLNEKMISGSWQHLLMKIIINDIIEKNISSSNGFKNLNIDTMDSEQVERLAFSNQLDSKCRDGLQFLWKEIIRRGSTLCGLMLNICIDEIYQSLNHDKLNICIIESGAVIEKAVGFRGNMIKILNNELQDLNLIEKTKIYYFSPKSNVVAGAVVLTSLFQD